MLDPQEFAQYFREINQGRNPFPWQERLAAQVCVGEWPDVIDLPTASGKTACIEIALFALALRPGAARRIFFVVDRRVVVSEASQRAKRIARALEQSLDAAPGSVSGRVAQRLRELAGGGESKPLASCELRGGIYRDESWVRTPLQPIVVTSTVDQVGSRLLFRGYGVSENSWPIHAGLVGNDSLIFLDEAHCSQAFAETLRSAARYRGADWADEPVPVGFRTVEMTATPSAAGRTVFRIEDSDKEERYLGPRLFARKPTRLVVSKNRPKELDKLAVSLFDEAMALSKGPQVRRVAVIVNRIATARKVHGLLSADGERAELMIGRMRPYDRDKLLGRLEDLKSGAKRSGGGATRFVVSTQCLEVGADLDFDGLVTECASMDALQQRFGRLNRLGQFDGESCGVIVIGSGQVDMRQRDPVYGEALARTWEWLNVVEGGTGALNMGIEAREGEPFTVAQRFADLPEKEKAALRMQSATGPLLLPAHLDALVQTNPTPAVEPEIALFLHGRREGEPDVQVVWRADLNGDNSEQWPDIVSLCPPVSAEAMQVPMSAFKRWFGGEIQDQADSDIEGAGGTEDADAEASGSARIALRWRGEKSEVVRSARKVRPGDTLVLPASTGGFDELGHKPAGARADIGDLARLIAKRRLTIRFHPDVWPGSEVVKLRIVEEGIAAITDEEIGAVDPDLKALLLEARGWRRGMEKPEWYPDPNRGDAFVLTGRGVSAGEDSGSDEPSQSVEVDLQQHLDDVAKAVGAYRELLGEKTEEYVWAAGFHDWGKADIRFQALLRGDIMAARFAPKPLAKSEWIPMGPAARAARRKRSGLPDGFRHEMVSLLFAERAIDRGEKEMGRHLIATHHGYARPLPPVVVDTTGEPVSYGGVTLTVEEQGDRAAYRLDSGVADRFWRLTRRYGWWGLAWYEALFRLADWEASGQGGKEKA